MSGQFLIQKVNYHKGYKVSAWFVTKALNPFEAINQGFDQWAPQVHPGLRSTRGNGVIFEACLRDGTHLVRATVER